MRKGGRLRQHVEGSTATKGIAFFAINEPFFVANHASCNAPPNARLPRTMAAKLPYGLRVTTATRSLSFYEERAPTEANVDDGPSCGRPTPYVAFKRRGAKISRINRYFL